MTYTLQCKECGHRAEYLMGMTDETVPCEECGTEMVRFLCRVWGADKYALQTNCTLGVSYDYVDPTLGVVKSKQHRKDLMKQKNVEEYHTDPDVQKHVDEGMYIRDRAGSGDRDAKAEADKCVKAAATVQREKNINAVFDRPDP